MSASNLFFGYGKLVLSGDSIVIRDRATDGPPSSRTVILSNIVCPKVGRRANISNEATPDEPFGWNAREFVRAKVIAHELLYTIENEVSTDRVFGNVYLGRDTSAPNLAHLLVAEGLARVRGNLSPAVLEKNPNLQFLVDLEERAKAEQKGMWSNSPEGAPRKICWAIPDPTSFFERFARKPLKAVVEFVRDGSSLNVQLLPIDGDDIPTYYNILLLLSGIKTPGSKLVDGERIYEPYSQDAQFYVESRLLQRDVTVILEGFSNNGFVGSVLHPNGNIAVFLLREGLARCIEWNLGIVSAEAGGAAAYRSAEMQAKEKRLRIWQDYIPPAPTGKVAETTGKKQPDTPAMVMEYTGRVVEVGNGDNVLVKCQDGKIRKFFLASIRPPRPAENNPAEGEKKQPQQPSQFVNRPLYQVPYLYEAREFLRKRLIGNQVKVLVDYVQPRPEGSTMDDKVCATVLIHENNIAEALVSRGLASVVRYRNPTDARSRAHDALLLAEANAAKKAVGIFDPKGRAPIHRLSELVNNVAKSRQHLNALTRAGPVDVLVEFVVSASRLRVEIPRESILCAILACGVVCPRPSRKLPNQHEEPGEPFGNEAREYVYEIINQRDVKFLADGMDRLGNLIGWITLNSDVKVAAPFPPGSKKGKKAKAPSISSKNLSVILVARGFATVSRAPNVQRSDTYAALLKAESFAQEHKLGLWSSEEFCSSWNGEGKFDEEEQNDATDMSANGAPNGFLSVKDLKKALPDDEVVKKSAADRLKAAVPAETTVTCNPEVGSNGLKFFVHLNNVKAQLDGINRELHSANFPSAEAVANFQPKRNMVCAARYSKDNLWYRARILRVVGKSVTVLFIDFGNCETIDTSIDGAPRLAALSKALSSQEPLATGYRLAYVQLPPNDVDRNRALDCLANYIIKQEIRVSPIQGTPMPCGKDDVLPVHSAVVFVKPAPKNDSDSSSGGGDLIDLAEKMLQDGLICLEKVRMPADICVRYSKAQNFAIGNHTNIWYYGDFRDDDE